MNRWYPFLAFRQGQGPESYRGTFRLSQGPESHRRAQGLRPGTYSARRNGVEPSRTKVRGESKGHLSNSFEFSISLQQTNSCPARFTFSASNQANCTLDLPLISTVDLKNMSRVVLVELRNLIHRLSWSTQNLFQPFQKHVAEKHKSSVGLGQRKKP